MADHPLTTVTGKIGALLSKIREVGVPTKATVQWLKSVGFKSSNDPTLLTAIRLTGFIDQSGAPTDTWKQYRGGKHGQVLANAIRNGYKDLYAVYPDAHARTLGFEFLRDAPPIFDVPYGIYLKQLSASVS